MKYTCPVCSWPGLDEPPYLPFGGDGSLEICPSCGTQFGITDSECSHAALRAAWVAGGKPWWSTAYAKPEDWQP